jgi:hypothetical protein
MTPREISQLLANVAQVTNFTKSLNINKEAIIQHSLTLKAATIKLEKWQKMYQDEEIRKTLSIEEQRVLMDNARSLYGVHDQLTKELDYLDMSKLPTFVSRAIVELEHAFLLIEWLLETVGKTGETILPHLTCIREKNWEGGKYKNKIDSLATELEAISYDFYQDHTSLYAVETNSNAYPILVPIADHIIVASCWLQKEKARLLTESIPEIKKIELPAEKVPEIPVGPAKDLKN